MGIVWVVAWNLAPDRFQPMVPAFAVQAGHGLWIVFGLIYLRRFDLSAIDLFLLAGGLVWLWLRPGRPPAIFLAAFQLVSLGFNLYLFQAVPGGSFEASALAVHILLRILAVALLIVGVRSLRRSAA